MSAKPYPKITHHSSKGAEKFLGALELAVMRVAWSHPTVTVRDVLSALNKKRSLAYTTVMTVMGRLADKGLLVAEKSGRVYQYRAAQTREEFQAQKASQIVHALIADFGGEVALSQFVKELSTTNPEQLSRLSEMARLAQGGKDEDR